MTASELRALGDGPLTIRTPDGSFTGWIDAAQVGDDAVTVLLRYRERGAPEDAVVIDLVAMTQAARVSDEWK